MTSTPRPATTDPDLIRTALATLPYDDQQLLWGRHVLGRPVEVVARQAGLHVRAAERRLRAAEDRLSLALSAAHARGVAQRLCVETRGALHDYANHRLGAGRRRSLEDHLFGCPGCMRAFTDVREASWALRDAGPLLAGGLVAAGAAGPVVVGAAGAATSSAGLLGWLGPVGAGLVAAAEWTKRAVQRLFGRPLAVAAGVGAAAVAVAAAAIVSTVGDGPPPMVREPLPVVAEASPSPTPSAVERVAPPSPAVPSEEPADESAEDPEPSDAPEPADPGPAAPPSDAGQGSAARGDADRDDTGGADADDAGGSSGDASGQGGTEPTPEPTREPSPDPTPEATPTPSPTPTESEPEPTPKPDPSPVVVTRTLDVEPWGVYRVVPSEGAEILSVSTSGHVRANVWGKGGSWLVTAGLRSGTVDVELTGPAGSTPTASLTHAHAR